MEAAMNNAAGVGQPTAGGAGLPGLPPVAGRAVFEAELGRLRVREKAHTREGDAIAAARRWLPMTEVDAGLTLTGPGGPAPRSSPGSRPIAQWSRLEAGRSDDLGSN